MLQLTQYDASAEDAVVALSLTAWAPVFSSMHAALGDAVYSALYPRGLSHQSDAVREVLANPDNRSWVASEDGTVIGFVATTVHAEFVPDASMGEIVMIAVDPEHQREGVGLRLTATALDWFREQGVTVAAVETGGDPGHGPARATYERAGFRLMPIARYFQVL